MPVQIAHLQDALNELRQSMKLSAEDVESQRQIGEAEAEARAQADRALLQVRKLTMLQSCHVMNVLGAIVMGHTVTIQVL